MKSILLEEEYHKKLKVLAADKEKSIKKLIKEAIDLLVNNYNKKEI